MQNVKISKDRLRKVVQENRDNHRKQFEEALDDYKKALESYLSEKIEDIRKGVLIDHYISLPQPQDHTDAYDQILEMLDMSVDKEITLTFGEFKQYVRDDWGWKGEFETSSSTLAMYNRTQRQR